jgi:DnaJ-class molecular chaperone with C-terminal Zn finger domain
MPTPDNIDPDPDAVCYHHRLDVPIDADSTTVRKAWKVASSMYHPDTGNPEATQKRYVRLQKARDVLSDPEARESYQLFCDEFGNEHGTECYEDWIVQGQPKTPERWVSSWEHTDSPELDEDSPSEDSSSPADDQHEPPQFDGAAPNTKRQFAFSLDRITEIESAIDDPQITRSNFDADGISVTRPSTERMRLYIRGFLSGEMYLDLDSGHLVGPHPVQEVDSNYQRDPDIIGFTDGEGRRLNIELGGSHTGFEATPDPSPSTDSDDSKSTEASESIFNEKGRDFFNSIKPTLSTNPVKSIFPPAQSVLETPGSLLLRWEFPRNFSIRVFTAIFFGLLLVGTDSPTLVSGTLIGFSIFFPRFGPWANSVGIVATVVFPSSFVAFLHYFTGLVGSVGYYLWVRGTPLDPYSSR